jgi:hypothetical protein
MLQRDNVLPDMEGAYNANQDSLIQDACGHGCNLLQPVSVQEFLFTYDLPMLLCRSCKVASGAVDQYTVVIDTGKGLNA